MLPKTLSFALAMVAVLPVFAGQAQAASTGQANGASEFSIEGFLQKYGDPFSGLAAIDAAVTALEVRLRDHADLTSVLHLAPDLTARLPEQARLHGVYATALAAAGDDAAARNTLEALGGRAGDTVWSSLAEALLARDAGDLAAADAAVQRALDADPANAYALNLSGMLSVLQGDVAAAEAAFAAAAATAPEAPSYHANLGAAQLRLGMPGPALTALDRAVALDPDNCATRRMRAAALSQQGRPAEAAGDLKRCLVADPETPDIAAELLSALLAAGDLTAAESVLDTHGKALNDEALWRAEVALRQGDAEKVRAALALASSPDSAAAAERRVYAALIDGDPAEAEAAIVSAVERDATLDSALRQAAFAVDAVSGSDLAADIDPVTPAEHFLAALSAIRAGDLRAAADGLTAAEGFLGSFTSDGIVADRMPSSELTALAAGTALMLRHADAPAAEALAEGAAGDAPLALYVAGSHARRTGESAGAMAYLTRAVGAAPDFRAAWLERSEAALASGEVATAINDLDRALRLRPAPSAALRLGVLAEAAGLDPVAREAYEMLLDLAPQSYVANNQLAWFLLSRDGASRRALELATRANELQPGNASILDTLGWLFYLNDDVPGALAHLEQAFEISRGRIPVIRYHLAAAALENGEAERAAEILGPFLDGPVPEGIAQDVGTLLARIEAAD